MVEVSSVTAVGAGIGVPLGVLAASFLALWLFERRKASRLKQQLAFQHHQFQQAPGTAPSYHNPSISNIASPPVLNRMLSSHSGVMSPTSGQPVEGGYGHPAMGMQRMTSSSSQHSAYQNVNMNHGYDNASPPPLPPPKPIGGQKWAAEAPGDETRRNTKVYSSAQELPTDR